MTNNKINTNLRSRELRITSIQAANQDFIIQILAEYLSERMGGTVEFNQSLPWQERERLFDAREIDIAWMCGLPYVRKAAALPAKISLLAAPVPKGQRYAGQPIYFSDVIVLKSSKFRAFEDLQGAVWAYNEPNSHSGYNLIRYQLASIGAPNGFFGRVVEAGSHQAAVKMVLDGRVDASAIDSTVLEIEELNQPGLAEKLRKITILGPSPVPAIVAHASMGYPLRETVKEMLLNMHLTDTGRKSLAKIPWRRFVAVSDQDYDPIRQMAHLANTVEW